jgi:hypothetical protein
MPKGVRYGGPVLVPSFVITRISAVSARALLAGATLAAGAAFILGGCAPFIAADTPATDAVERTRAPEASLGALDTVYDRSKWQWVINVDGRPLLRHTEVPQCYLDPDPPHHFHEPAFRLKREAKTFGMTRYQVILAYEGEDFWEAVYIPPSSSVPLLGVYAPGRCQEEAERILEVYERQRQRYVEGRPDGGVLPAR